MPLSTPLFNFTLRFSMKDLVTSALMQTTPPLDPANPYVPNQFSPFRRVQILQEALLLTKPSLFYEINDQILTLKPVDDNFFKTPSCTKEIFGEINKYATLKIVNYCCPFDQPDPSLGSSLEISYRRSHISGYSTPPENRAHFVDPYDNTGFYVLVAMGKSDQLYFSFMGSEAQLYEIAIQHGFEEQLNTFIKSLGGIRMETTKLGFPTADYPAFEHPAFITKLTDELPDVVSFSEGFCGEEITYEGHKYTIVCIENVVLDEEEEESAVSIDDSTPVFYERSGLQKVYLLLEINKRKDADITTIHVPVFEIDALFEEAKLRSKGTKRKQSDSFLPQFQFETETETETDGKKLRLDDVCKSSKPGFFDELADSVLDEEIIGITKGATSSPQESSEPFILPVVVDRVIRDRTPSPPAEIEKILKTLRQ